MKIVIGIDEVGRGPLAGPVSVCAVACRADVYTVLKKSKLLPKPGIDSKKLNSIDREKYSDVLLELGRQGKISYSISHISNKLIDSKGITFAIKKAISKNIKNLDVHPEQCRVLLDGSLKAPIEFRYQKTIIKGDEKERIISWASILAKVSRDNLMCKLGKKYPTYGFEINKGYGTKKHRVAIKKHGLSSVHRASFCLNY